VTKHLFTLFVTIGSGDGAAFLYVKTGISWTLQQVITGSSKIIDVSGSEPITYVGYVPERSVVIPGSVAKEFPAGTFQVNCALIIGKRKESTDLKTSLNDALRDHGVTV